MLSCFFSKLFLDIFNKVKAKKGIRFTYQTCLATFAVAIFSFFAGSTMFWGDNALPKIIIGAVGGIFGSWAIGAFFMMPYLAPAQIASVEQNLTGRNHTAMYFAANAVTTSIVGAISGSLVYEYIKNLFISKEASGIVWAQSAQSAAEQFGLGSDFSSVFNLGNLLVPFIVCASCLGGFFLAFKMPKDYTPDVLAREFKNMDPSLDISEFENAEVKVEKKEVIFVQIGLSILSGFIFGFIWLAFVLKSMKELAGTKRRLLCWLLSCFVPFASIYFFLSIRRDILSAAKERGIEMKMSKAALIVSAIILPIAPLNLVALSLTQHKINKFYA